MFKYKRVNIRNEKGIEEGERLQRLGWEIISIGWDNIIFEKRSKNKGEK